MDRINIGNYTPTDEMKDSDDVSKMHMVEEVFGISTERSHDIEATFVANYTSLLFPCMHGIGSMTNRIALDAMVETAKEMDLTDQEYLFVNYLFGKYFTKTIVDSLLHTHHLNINPMNMKEDKGSGGMTPDKLLQMLGR